MPSLGESFGICIVFEATGKRKLRGTFRILYIKFSKNKVVVVVTQAPGEVRLILRLFACFLYFRISFRPMK